MDSDFLSQPQVVAASRNFVCVRLATYEDKVEGAFLASLFKGRSGELENTVFAFMSPDGKKMISRSGRGCRQVFGSLNNMLDFMEKTARQYRPRKTASAPPLPGMKNLRLSINVAACDGRALIVATSTNKLTLKAMQKKLSPLAWSDSLAGQFEYASASNISEIKSLGHTNGKSAFLLIKPDQFGQKGKIVATIDSKLSNKEIKAGLEKYLKGQSPASNTDRRNHVRAGVQAGIKWNTEIPITDPGIPIGSDRRGPPRR